MRGRPRLGNRGMTLIELMIVLAILSITSQAIFSILFASLKTYWKGDVATQVQQGARISVDRMVRDMRQARRLLNGVNETVGSTTVAFNISCTTPQISFVLPHLGTVSLSDGSSIYGTDPNSSGTIPYDGTYVTYYLAAAVDGTTPNTAGPYLIRASYDLVANTITVSTVASNITTLSLNPGGACPTTATTEFTVQLIAQQTQTGQNVASQVEVTDDVDLRGN
jgi:prepilin-type N-terminal cleavage/methylation domain-containing protein